MYFGHLQYRYSTKCERLLVVVALIVATISGLEPAIANITFGRLTKSMVEYASNASRQCPPPPSNETSPFMRDVETFVLYQSLLAFSQLLFGYLFVMTLNYVAENQTYKIRKEYFRKLLQQEIGWFDKNAKRDFSSRMVE